MRGAGPVPGQQHTDADPSGRPQDGRWRMTSLACDPPAVAPAESPASRCTRSGDVRGCTIPRSSRSQSLAPGCFRSHGVRASRQAKSASRVGRRRVTILCPNDCSPPRSRSRIASPELDYTAQYAALRRDLQSRHRSPASLIAFGSVFEPEDHSFIAIRNARTFCTSRAAPPVDRDGARRRNAANALVRTVMHAPRAPTLVSCSWAHSAAPLARKAIHAFDRVQAAFLTCPPRAFRLRCWDRTRERDDGQEATHRRADHPKTPRG